MKDLENSIVFSLDFLLLSLRYVRNPFLFLSKNLLWKLGFLKVYDAYLRSGERFQNLIYVDLVTYHIAKTGSFSGWNKKRFDFLKRIVSERDYSEVDFYNKTVFDIGGFVGDSARDFLDKGAKSVIVFEPVPEKIGLINVILKNEIEQERATVFNVAVCGRDGTSEIESTFHPLSVCFGIKYDHSPFLYKTRVHCMSWDTLLHLSSQYQPDLIKVDCEGCERYLLDVEGDFLRNFREWVMEIHGGQLKERLVEKFTASGFKAKCLKESQDSVVYFSL